MAAAVPGANTRWRCGGCGNLTRFDVTRTRRTTEFWHFDLAGDHRVEDSRTDHEDVSAVTCRWCGRSDAVELVTRAEAIDSVTEVRPLPRPWARETAQRREPAPPTVEGSRCRTEPAS